MTDTLTHRRSGGGAARVVYLVREERDVRTLEAALSRDRSFAAYALGHLEPGLFDHARFYTARPLDGGGAGHATVMHAGALGRTTVVDGAPEAVDAILGLHPGSRASYLSTCAPEHLPALRRAYHVTDALTMMRMTLTPAGFNPELDTLTGGINSITDGSLRRLRGRDANAINRLYATEGGPSHYSQEAIERAVYYGAYDGQRLVSVAGTHIVAPNQSIAIVGNVFTDAAYRGLGLATRVTGAVTRELLERGCGEVTLTVNPTNAPAVAAYTKLGYRPGSTVVEARLHRRDLLGLGAALRRATARRRGRSIEPNTELVYGRATAPPGEHPGRDPA